CQRPLIGQLGNTPTHVGKDINLASSSPWTPANGGTLLFTRGKRKAQKNGRCFRASYTLFELNEMDRLSRPGMLVVDLGSTPGGQQARGRERPCVGHPILPTAPCPTSTSLRATLPTKKRSTACWKRSTAHKRVSRSRTWLRT